jgi:hypothetical protein
MCLRRTLLGLTVGALFRVCCGCGHREMAVAWNGEGRTARAG